MTSAGHSVDVVCVAGPGERLVDRMGEVRIYRLPIPSRRAGPMAYVLRYAAFFVCATVVVALLHLRRRYQLIQVHSLPDPLVFAALVPRLLGVPVLLDLHECMPEFYMTKFGRGRNSRFIGMLEHAEQASIRFASSVITCTDQMRDLFVQRGAPAEKITVVLNSADEDVFKSTGQPDVPDDGLVLISHGTIEERYGLDTAIRALQVAAGEVPGLRLEIYGDGSYVPDLRSLARQLGVEERVFFSDGYVPLDELVAALGRADAGLVAMKQDAFRDVTHCNKMFEFIAMGKPVIVSRTRAVEEYFDESCFLMFMSGDERDLAAAMVRLAGDVTLRGQLAARAREANEPYRWPHQATRYIAVVNRYVGVDGEREPTSSIAR